MAANSEKELAQSEFEEKLSTLGEINSDFAQELNNRDWKKKSALLKQCGGNMKRTKRQTR